MLTHTPRAVKWYTDEEETELARRSSELRKERLHWCKERALAELPNVTTAMASMVSDAGKPWEDARGDTHPFLFNWSDPIYELMLADGMFFASKSERTMRHWIEGFN
jgi:hypothetical protein